MKKFLLPLSFVLATMIPGCSLVENTRPMEARINNLNVKVERRYHLDDSLASKIEHVNLFYYNKLVEIKNDDPKARAAAEVLKSDWEYELINLINEGQSSKD